MLHSFPWMKLPCARNSQNIFEVALQHDRQERKYVPNDYHNRQWNGAIMEAPVFDKISVEAKQRMSRLKMKNACFNMYNEH